MATLNADVGNQRRCRPCFYCASLLPVVRNEGVAQNRCRGDQVIGSVVVGGGGEEWWGWHEEDMIILFASVCGAGAHARTASPFPESDDGVSQ